MTLRARLRACALGALFVSTPARADEPRAVFRDPRDPRDPLALPDAPAPPSLPDLTHRGLALSLETTFASLHSAYCWPPSNSV